jgi:hypothetical protein
MSGVVIVFGRGDMLNSATSTKKNARCEGMNR